MGKDLTDPSITLGDALRAILIAGGVFGGLYLLLHSGDADASAIEPGASLDVPVATTEITMNPDDPNANTFSPVPITGHGIAMLAFPAYALDVWTEAYPGATNPNTVQLNTASGVLASDPTILAVLDGPMFTITDSSHPTYGTARFARLDYALRGSTAQEDGTPRTDASGLTIAVVNNAAAVSSGDTVPAGARVAVQGYPSLVIDGIAVARTDVNQDTTWRAALVVLTDGRIAFAIGRMSMRAFADALVAMGAKFALYTDGGGSGLMMTRAGAWGSTENRRVASWLVVRT